MFDRFDDVMAKIILSAGPGDSILRVAKKIDEPYETVRQKVKRMEEKNIVEIDKGVHVLAPNLKKTIYELSAAFTRFSSISIEDAYVLPHFSDYPFAFTRIDASYIWTRGGYQVSRSYDDYAIFIRVDESVRYWNNFFKDFGIPSNEERRPVEYIDGSIQVVIEKGDLTNIEWIEGYPVISLEETVEYMLENRVHFLPGLEMIGDMYPEVNLNMDQKRGVA